MIQQKGHGSQNFSTKPGMAGTWKVKSFFLDEVTSEGKPEVGRLSESQPLGGEKESTRVEEQRPEGKKGIISGTENCMFKVHSNFDQCEHHSPGG